MRKGIKKILAVGLGCSIMLSATGCVTTDDTGGETGTVLTLETMQSWCDEAGTAFFEGFKYRDCDVMDDYIPNSQTASFDAAYTDFFDVQSRKVWLDGFYEDYLEGSQVISSTFISDGQVVSMEFAIITADYSAGNRNWLLLYDTTLYFGIDLENERADILNPEVVFDLYRDMSNDYTTHIAATVLGVTDDFDISNYYYDEELGVYIDRDPEEVARERAEEEAEAEESANVVVEVPEESIPEESVAEET